MSAIENAVASRRSRGLGWTIPTSIPTADLSLLSDAQLQADLVTYAASPWFLSQVQAEIAKRAAVAAVEAARIQRLKTATGGTMPPILFYEGREPTSDQADWGGNVSYALAAVGRPIDVVNGKIFYTPFAPAIWSGNPQRPSYMYQDWAYPDWIAQQVAAGNISAYTYNGTAGMLVAPATAIDYRFSLKLTGTFRGSNDTDNGLLSYIGTIAQIVAFVFPPSAPILQPIATAIQAYDAVNTGNILEGLGAALSIPGVPNLTLTTVGTTTITASNVIGAANVVQGVQTGNLLQAVSGTVALPGISDFVQSTTNSIENYFSGTSGTVTNVPNIPDELNPQVLDYQPAVAQYANPLENIGANTSPNTTTSTDYFSAPASSNVLDPGLKELDAAIAPNPLLDTSLPITNSTPLIINYSNPLENIGSGSNTTVTTETSAAEDKSLIDQAKEAATAAASALPSLKTIGTALAIGNSALALEQKLTATATGTKPATPIYTLSSGATQTANGTGLTFSNFAPILLAIGAAIIGSSS